MAKITAKVKLSPEAKKARTAEHKACRAARIARQLAKSALTFASRGRAGRRAK